MQTINVNLDLQIRIIHSIMTPIIATCEDKVRVFYNTSNTVTFIDLIDKKSFGEMGTCKITTDMDINVNWFKVVGTGTYNQTNIIKALRIVRKWKLDHDIK